MLSLFCWFCWSPQINLEDKFQGYPWICISICVMYLLLFALLTPVRLVFGLVNCKINFCFVSIKQFAVHCARLDIDDLINFLIACLWGNIAWRATDDTFRFSSCQFLPLYIYFWSQLCCQYLVSVVGIASLMVVSVYSIILLFLNCYSL